MEIILGWIGGIGLLFVAIVIIVLDIFRVVTLFKCRKVKICQNRKCIVKEMCGKYSHLPTEKELDETEQMINGFREAAERKKGQGRKNHV